MITEICWFPSIAFQYIRILLKVKTVFELLTGRSICCRSEAGLPLVDDLLAAADGGLAAIAPEAKGHLAVEARQQRVVVVAEVGHHLKAEREDFLLDWLAYSQN